MTLHGYALTDIEAGELSAIRDRHEFCRNYHARHRPETETAADIDRGQLLGWHDRFSALLAERESEIDRLRAELAAAKESQ